MGDTFEKGLPKFLSLAVTGPHFSTHLPKFVMHKEFAPHLPLPFSFPTYPHTYIIVVTSVCRSHPQRTENVSVRDAYGNVTSLHLDCSSKFMNL